MGQPRKNEEQFYLYPMQRVVAVFSDEKQAYAACRQLEAEGFNLSSVHLLSGPEGARLLDAHGARRGVVARITRFLQQGAYEGKALEVHAAALRRGECVLYVPTRNKERIHRAVDVLRENNGRWILHFRRWAIEQFPNGAP
ncbi:hypothetical protein ACWELO_34360 [Streptomyces sp. NPDC004596]|uniref:hypothetical protein n=1 Tax=Streptomyces sp. DSM 118148 TaxID=3448667 RepID=UPI00403FFB5A